MLEQMPGDCGLILSDDLASLKEISERCLVSHEIANHQTVQVINLDPTHFLGKTVNPIHHIPTGLCDQTMRAECNDLKQSVFLNRELCFRIIGTVEEAITNRCNSGLIRARRHGESGLSDVEIHCLQVGSM